MRPVGRRPTASRRRRGSPRSRAPSADSSPPTWSRRPARSRLTQLEGAFSPISEVRVEAGGVDVTAPVVIGSDGVGTVELGAEVPAGPMRLTITGITARQTLDRRFGEPVELPAALAEIEGVVTTTTMPRRVSVPCRDDLLQVDGLPLAVSFETTTASMLAGDPVTATVCGDATVLTPGRHRLTTTAGTTGWQVDRVVLGTTPAGGRR